MNQTQWMGILQAAEAQDIKWKIPMPDLITKHGIYVWVLKAQEEMGELSAAMLSYIGHRKPPKDTALTECEQLISILLRIHTMLTSEDHGPTWCKEEGGTYEG